MVPDNPLHNPGNELTISAWIKPNTPMWDFNPIVVKRDYQSGYTLEVQYGNVSFWPYITGRSLISSPSATLVPDQWNHVVGVYNGTTVSLYLNGDSIGTPTYAPGGIQTTSSELDIGHDPSYPWRSFPGLIDEVLIFNRAISTSEIQDIYNAGSAGICQQGVFLSGQSKKGVPGQVVDYQATLINLTGIPDSFNLSLGPHIWQTSLSADVIGPIENGQTTTFNLSVTIPADAAGDAIDLVSVTATSVINQIEYSTIAIFTTRSPLSPVADFGFWPYDPNRFDTVNFWSNSFDPEGSWIQSLAWDFGDGATSSDWWPSHRFTTDGDYSVKLTVTTGDGRIGSKTTILSIRTHDVFITGFEVPTTAKAGQTRDILVYLANNKYPETVQMDLYKSTPWGYELVDSKTLEVPVKSGQSTTEVAFKYRFTSDDASYGKVSFKVVVSVLTARDAMPEDNTIVQFPTRVNP